MLYIQYKDDSGSNHWSDPKIQLKDLMNVELVQADGHELEHILEFIEGIPIAKEISPWSDEKRLQRVQTWTGDFARFIVRNW